MNQTATKIYEVITSYDVMDKDKVLQVSKSLSGRFDEISTTIRELLFQDNTTFESLFCMSYNKQYQLKIISDYFDIAIDSLNLSPKHDETIRFCNNTMTCEGLAKLYNSVKTACNINLNEFIFSWYVLNLSGEFACLFIDKGIDVELLDDKIKQTIIKIKQEETKLKTLSSMINKTKKEIVN